MEENNQRVTSYKEVSEALGKKLIKLYGEKIFPRQGKVFADMLFQTGVEAGAYLASLADIEERSVKINLATNAMIKLNQADYLIDVMREAKYYTAVQVVELDEFLQGLTTAMRELLNSAYAQMRAEGSRKAALAAKEAAQSKPQAKVQPKVQPKPQAQPKPSNPQQPPQPKINPDPDGFLIIADGEAHNQAPAETQTEENNNKK
ncbi:MAG: hypothetical protein K2L72_04750 [Clostridia bacterium]|nr:hypothetical protein [Clostridia bacterium]